MVGAGSRYLKARKYMRPKALPGYFMGWLPTSYCSTQTDIIATAGYDAAMYIRILSFGVSDCRWLAACQFLPRARPAFPHAPSLCQAWSCSCLSRSG